MMGPVHLHIPSRLQLDCPALRKLDVSSCAPAAILGGGDGWPLLERLHVGDSSLDDDGLATWVAGRARLRHLYLQDNRRLTDAAGVLPSPGGGWGAHVCLRSEKRSRAPRRYFYFDLSVCCLQSY